MLSSDGPTRERGLRRSAAPRCSIAMSGWPAHILSVPLMCQPRAKFGLSARDRPDIGEARRAFIRRQPALDPNHLVFIDETWAATNMVRRYGRAARGLRLLAPVPHGHWKVTTLVAGLRCHGITAPCVFD